MSPTALLNILRVRCVTSPSQTRAVDISSLSFSIIGFLFRDPASQSTTPVSSNEPETRKCRLWKSAHAWHQSGGG